MECRRQVTSSVNLRIRNPVLRSCSILYSGNWGWLNCSLPSSKHNSKIKYDLTNYVRLLVYGRILAPASKLATVEENTGYYTPLIRNDTYLYHVYDTP